MPADHLIDGDVPQRPDPFVRADQRDPVPTFVRNIGPGDNDYGRAVPTPSIDSVVDAFGRYSCTCHLCGDLFTDNNKRAVTCPACIAQRKPAYGYGSLSAPAADNYAAGPCPHCGEFAVAAERRPDGRVECRNGHWWDRGAHAAYLMGIDLAKPGAERTVGTFDFSYRVIFDRGLAGEPTLMRVIGGSGEILLSAKLAQFPTDKEMLDIVKGIDSAADGGIRNLAARISNPTAAAVIDSLWKH